MNELAAFGSDVPPLARYEAACRAIAEANSVDEVKEARAGAAAMLAYARQAKNRQLEIDATEIRFRAERRLGELIAAQRKAVGLNAGAAGSAGPGRGNAVPLENRVSTAPTLAEAGIDKKLSARAQKYAAVPESEFNGLLTKRREMAEQHNVRVSTDLLAPNPFFRTLASGEMEWYTPGEYIELARQVLGSIDLDPASSVAAQRNVQAARYFTMEDDGLKQEWSGRVWLNPPYSRNLMGPFIDKLLAHYKAGEVPAAIALTHAYTDSSWFIRLAKEATAVCLTTGRVQFISPTGSVASPTQGQAFFYLGCDLDRFAQVFGGLGVIMATLRPA